MARPRRRRRVCSEPVYDSFAPKGGLCEESVILTVDEYEMIRLIDLDGLTHEQCGARMEISRTTVTEMYERARRKLADCLVNGKELRIEGGSYRLCDGSAVGFCGGCKKFSNVILPPEIRQKGGNEMRIAVPYEKGEIFQHFGHTEEFMVYDAEKGNIINRQSVPRAGCGHGALADFLRELKTDVLICGGIGQGAVFALEEAEIKICGGVSGSADEAVKKFLEGSLIHSAEANCNRHNDNNEGQGHCGGQGGCHKKGGNCHE